MARRFPIVAGSDGVKIVWRMTGSGPLKLAAYDGRGRRLGLAWGPEPLCEGGSTYAPERADSAARLPITSAAARFDM
jgi:hypothetical protein